MERLPLRILSPLPVAGRQLCFHRQRYPEVRRLADRRAEKFFWGDVDNRVSDLVNCDGLADRRRVGAKLALPPGVTYDGDRMRAGDLIVGVSDDASQTGAYSQRGEIGAGDRLYVNSYHFAARPVCVDGAVYAPTHTQDRPHIGEDFIAPPHLSIKRIGEEAPALVREVVGRSHPFAFAEENQLFRLSH